MSEERRDSGPRSSGPRSGGSDDRSRGSDDRSRGSDDRPRRRFGGGGGGGRYYPRRKVCTFCMDQIADIDYKDIGRLRRHVSDRGKIEPRRQSGTCAKHQRALAVAIKRARHVALIAFSQ